MANDTSTTTENINLTSVFAQIEADIAESEKITAAKEQADRDAGKKLKNGLLSRLHVPPRPLNPGESMDEVVLVHTDSGLKPMKLCTSQTRFLPSRRQWGAYEKAMNTMKDAGLSEEEIQREQHARFEFTYGAMAICRRYDENGRSHLLMGIRGAKLATLNVGEASFPAGMANPCEPLQMVVFRELEEETGLGMDRVSYKPGFATFRFPNACSMTFSILAETRSQQPIKKCYEVEKGVFTWVPEDALRQALVEKNPLPLVEAFRAQGVNVKDDLKVSNDGTATYLTLSKVYPA